MKENYLRVAVWAPLSLLMALSLVSKALAADGECDQAAAKIYQAASPAVVYISATTINPYRVADLIPVMR